MKIGDKVLCIKEIYNNGQFGLVYWHHKNKYYKIIGIGITEKLNIVNIESEQTNIGNHLTFNLDRLNNIRSFSTYFINVTEERAIKLKKLNGLSNL